MKYQIISERTMQYDKTISYPTDTLPVLKRYANKRKEHFYVLTLNGSHKLIKVNLVSIGILNRAIVHPREVFRPAIIDGAASIIISHNHPSGSLEKSIEDEEVTKRLAKAGDLLGIPILDHIIISKNGYYSFAENCQALLDYSNYAKKVN